MKPLGKLEQYRDRYRERHVYGVYGVYGGDEGGAFSVPSPIDRKPLTIIASNGEGWDHVSVSRPNRCPNWIELEHVKRLFFEEHETAMQLHVPSDDHISVHDFCLHLWRPQEMDIPRPPGWMVGVKNAD